LDTKLTALIAAKASQSDFAALKQQVDPVVKLISGPLHIRFNDNSPSPPANQCLTYIQPGTGGAGFSGCDSNYKFQTLQIIPQ
jgi:hypothetical protein